MLKQLTWQLTGKCKYCGNNDFRFTTQQESFDEHMVEERKRIEKEYGREFLLLHHREYSNSPVMFGWRKLKICTQCDKIVKWWD